MSLALSTLLYEWRRYLAAVIALSVAGLLVLAFTGMFMGMAKSFTATIDRSPAQIMVLEPQATSLFGNSSGQPRRIIPMVYQHPEVAEVMPLQNSWGFFSNFPEPGQPPKSNGVQVIIIDPIPGAVTLPNDFDEATVLALQEPYSVVMDKTNLAKLGVKLNDKAKINNRTVNVKATVTGYPSMFQTTVFMSRQTARLLGLIYEGPRVGPLLVKVNDPTKAQQVAAELNAMSGGLYKAWPREALSGANQMEMLNEGGISVILGFAVLVGIFIGIVITWQTLQGAILANIKEFASLRALGVSMGSLRLIIMELSFWVGVAGLFFTFILTAGITLLAEMGAVPMDFPLPLIIFVIVMLLSIAVLSGLFSLGVLKKSQPADLLR